MKGEPRHVTPSKRRMSPEAQSTCSGLGVAPMPCAQVGHGTGWDAALCGPLWYCGGAQHQACLCPQQSQERAEHSFQLRPPRCSEGHRLALPRQTGCRVLPASFPAAASPPLHAVANQCPEALQLCDLGWRSRAQILQGLCWPKRWSPKHAESVVSGPPQAGCLHHRCTLSSPS